MTLRFEVPETEKHETGEIFEELIERKNVLVWSDLVSSCDTCSSPVTSLVELKKHNEHKHKSHEIQISCSSCAKTFKTVNGLMNHINRHEHQKHLTHCCVYCNKIFTDLNLLHRHESVSHSDITKLIFQCLICGFYKESIGSLERHCKQSHSKTEDIPIKRRTVNNSEESNAKSSKKIKANQEESISESETSSDDSDSDFEEDCRDHANELDDEDKPVIKRTKKEPKTKRIQTEPASAYFGPEIDSFEKLFEEELKGTSKFLVKPHLNIDKTCQLPNGEISEEFASKVSAVRWNESLKCAICEKRFTNMCDFFNHIEKNHARRHKLYDCTYCKSKFRNYHVMINHHAEKHFFEHLKFCCLVCSKMFYDFPTLIDHFNTHKANFKLYICLICAYYSKSLCDLKEHKATHMLDTKRGNEHVCDIVLENYRLGKVASAKNSCVAEHEKNADGSVKDEFQEKFKMDWSFGFYECPPCNLTFEDPFNLFMHQRQEHPKAVIKKAYNCTLCPSGKSFSNIYIFANHAFLKHFDDGKYTCLVCNKAFWNIVALSDHYTEVHPAFTVIVCCHCGKIFLAITSAADHFKSLKFLKTPEERKMIQESRLHDEMNHICHVCAKSFRSRALLYSHDRVHAEQKSTRVQCNICKKT
jgi:hypothetical protein